MASNVTRRLFTTTVRRLQQHEKQELAKETKKNPETLVLGAVMLAALSGAGYYFGRSPTGPNSESPVNVSSMPWEGQTSGKYQFYPGGDPNSAPKDAPSALNTVVVPNVTLPKDLHDKFNKWGKDGYP